MSAKKRDFQWFEAPGKSAKWARRAAVSSDGIIYIPGAIAGGEMNVFLCASYDGTSAVLDGDHVYYPSDWLKREFPESKDVVELIERRIKETMSADHGD